MSQANNQPYQKNHSFSKPVSMAQAASWAVFLSQALIFYIYVINQYHNTIYQVIFNVLYTSSFVILIISALWTGRTDPTDDLVIANNTKDLQKIIAYKQKSNKLFYCTLCQSAVKHKSRHCRVCGKCSENFDHHCIWLNICIGDKNYRPFIVTITMTFLNFFFYLLAISFLTQEMRVTYSDMKNAGFILMWIVGFVVAVFEFLISNLILLHIYLNFKGISTYQFVLLRAQQKIKEEEQEKLEKQRKNQEQKKKKTNKGEQQSSAAFLRESKKRMKKNVKSIDDTFLEDKTSRQNDQKSDKKSQLQYQNAITKRTETTSNLPSTMNFANKIDIHQSSQVRLSQFKKIDSNPKDSERNENISMVSSSKKSDKQSVQNEEPSSVNLNQNQKKYMTRKPTNQKSINQFFARNASFDLFFSRKDQTLQPHEDICKAIELDEQIKQYKKRKQNLSLVIQSKLQNRKQEKPEKLLLFDRDKKKFPIHDYNIINGSGVSPSLEEKKFLPPMQPPQMILSRSLKKAIKQKSSMKSNEIEGSTQNKQTTIKTEQKTQN